MNPDDQDAQKIEVKKPDQATETPVPGQSEQAVDTLPEEPKLDEQPKDESVKVIPPQGGHKKRRWIWMLLALVLLGGLAYWWFVVKSDKSVAPTTTTNQSQTTQVTNTYTPVNIVYAFKGDGTPYTLYTRPAIGGERVASETKLETSEVITGSDVNGDNAVFASDKAIYTSTDGGKTYKAIIKLSQGEQITTVKLATDGKSMVYGYLMQAAEGKNVVKVMNLDGTDSKDLFTSDKDGVFIIGYDSAKQKVVYREGCYNCDGPAGLPIVKDLKTNKNTSPVSGMKDTELVDVEVDTEFTSLVYVKATHNPSGDDNIDLVAAAPYTINTVDLTSNKVTQVATFGTKDEKNPNGTMRYRKAHVGFVAGTSTPYYTNDGQLYIVTDGKESLVHEATKPLLYVPFVGKEVVIVGSDDQTADYNLVSYNIAGKKTTDIFSGDNNTIIFGVTTK